MDFSKPKPPGTPGQARSAKRLESPMRPDEPVNTSGRVKFDDRGNAIWEWSMQTGKFEPATPNQLRRSLEASGLALAEEVPTSDKSAKPNPLGTKTGYDPYESGRLSGANAEKNKKKDLRKLGEWLNLKKQARKNKDSED